MRYALKIPVGRFFQPLLIPLKRCQVVVGNIYSIGKEDGGKRYSSRVSKKFWIMRYLFFQYDSQANLHAIAKEVGQKLGITVRDEDIHELLDELVSKGMVEGIRVRDSEMTYRMSKFGHDWWRLYASGVQQLL